MVVPVRHHGLLRLASTLWVSVACVGQVDVLPAGVPDRQALLECVARPRVVGLYGRLFLGEVGLPGDVVRKVYSVFSTVFLLLLLLAVAVGCPAACFGR